MVSIRNRHIEKALAVASFLVATALAFLSLYIREAHDIEAGVAMVIAQFLLLTASILGIDYKFNSHDYLSTRNPQQ